MANLFEDVEDPFADDFNDGINSPPLNKNPSKSALLRGPAVGKKPAGARGQYGEEYYDDGSYTGTPNHLTPHGGEGMNMNFMQSSLVNKKAVGQGSQMHQRGYQFRIKDKAFLVYLRKFPLYA